MKKKIQKITEKYRKSLSGNYVNLITIGINIVIYRIDYVVYVNGVL